MLKKSKQDKQKTFFNFDNLIINGQIYRGKETKDLPYYCKMAKIINALIPWSVSNWTVPPRPLDVKNFV